MNPICPGCRKRPRRASQYLCSACWMALPKGSQQKLIKKDGYAMKRIRKLHSELEKGTPLQDIRIDF